MTTLARNVSTGRLLRGTGGALCIGCCGGGNCTHCSSPPSTISVKFENTSSRSVCCRGTSGGPDNYEWTERFLPSFDILLLPDIPSVADCTWQRYWTAEDLGFSNGYHAKYIGDSGNYCSGTPTEEVDYIYFIVQVVRYETTARISAWFSDSTGTSGNVMTAFTKNNYTPVSNCVGTGATTLTNAGIFPYDYGTGVCGVIANTTGTVTIYDS